MFSLLKPTFAETRTYILSHGAILWPIAFATFGIGQALAILAFGQSRGGAAWTMPLGLMMLGGLLWSQIGYLTISGVLLAPGESVGQQLARALGKLPFLILTFIISLFVILALLIPFMLAAQLNGLTVAEQTTAGPVASLFLVLPLLVLMLILFAKLYLAWAGLMDNRFSGLRGIVHGLALTRGKSFFFLIASLLFVFLFQASQFLGGLFGSVLISGITLILGQSSGSPALIALTAGAFSAAPMLFSTIFAALLYTKLSQQGDVRR